MGSAAWHQLQGEPDNAYRVFCLYLQCAPPRMPAARLGATYSVLPWVVLDWCRAWQWDRRAAAYDAWYAKEHADRLKALAEESAESNRAKNRELVVMAREYAADQLSKLLAESRKSNYSRSKAREIAQVMKLAIELDGMLEDRVIGGAAHHVDDGFGDDLTDEELEQWDQLQAKARGARKADIA